MAIKRDLLKFQTVEDLLGTGRTPLRIPVFQEPYSWTPHPTGTRHHRKLATKSGNQTVGQVKLSPDRAAVPAER